MPTAPPSTLFSPFALGPVELPNRIVVAPMCQYAAHDGTPGPWHLPHYLQLAMGGAGLVVFEATHVERPGRITHGCLGLYEDAHEIALTQLLAQLRQVAPPGTRFGIQLAHAGRKASAARPWEGGKALGPAQDPWQTVAPSALPFADGWHTPAALDAAGLERVRNAFVRAAERAVRIGFDVVELHAAHGYLLHAFHSPLSNHRTDAYGGSAEARMRFPLEVAAAVRAALPPHVAMGARITGSDYAEGGLTVDDAVALAAALKAAGAVFVCVSGGGNVARPDVHPAAGYQVPLAARVRSDAAIATRAVGLIVDPVQAERIVATGDADLVALARAFLDNPRWGWHAAQALGAPPVPVPPQYARVAPALWPGAAIARPGPGDSAPH
jgi:2,4-dienoyl-CoA reductase-like NADH-dependent reductase (Old Yellow Enzyme family)